MEPTSLFGHIAAKGTARVARELGVDTRGLYYLLSGKNFFSMRFLDRCTAAWGQAHDEVATFRECRERNRAFYGQRSDEGAAA